MSESTITLTAGGVKFKYVVMVVPRELEFPTCPTCNGSKQIGSGWLDDDIEECPECQGRGTVRALRFFDHNLEEYLRDRMDEYLEKKYPLTN